MPPISELTAASELSGTSGSIAPDGVKEGTRSSSIGGGYWAPSPGTPAGASAPPAAPPASGAPGATVG